MKGKEKKLRKEPNPSTPPEKSPSPENQVCEECLNPCFTETPQISEESNEIPEEDDETDVDIDEDWHWRQPEDFWVEGDVWPWPNPSTRRKNKDKSPDNIEP